MWSLTFFYHFGDISKFFLSFYFFIFTCQRKMVSLRLPEYFSEYLTPFEVKYALKNIRLGQVVVKKTIVLGTPGLSELTFNRPRLSCRLVLWSSPPCVSSFPPCQNFRMTSKSSRHTHLFIFPFDNIWILCLSIKFALKSEAELIELKSACFVFGLVSRMADVRFCDFEWNEECI